MSRPEPHSEERIRRRYSFGEFTLDVEHRTLQCAGQDLALRPKSFEVLVCLVEHHGHLTTRGELMETVWPGTTVTDNSLAQCMVEIRRALDDDAQQLIRTVARRGYMFAAPVTTPVLEFAIPSIYPEASRNPVQVMSRSETIPPPGVPAHHVRVSGALALVAACAGAAALGSLAWRMWRASENPEPFRTIPLNSLPGVQRYPSFSPDGNHVAFTWTGPKQNNQDVYVQQIGSGSPLRLTPDPRIDYIPVVARRPLDRLFAAPLGDGHE